MSGISVDYLVRLEQGRARNPSPQVLASLARALRISSSERDILYRAAGVAPPAAGIISTHVSPGVHRILDRLENTPVAAYTASWDFVQSNTMWDALFAGEVERVGREANLVWRAFTLKDIPVIWGDGEATAFQRDLVADLHAAASGYPRDPGLSSLIADLRRKSTSFDDMWREWDVTRQPAPPKRVRSATVGTVTLDCDILTTHDVDLRLVVYTAPPGSEDAEKLDLLRVVGVQGS
ncbi:transcriptional regulator [Microbacterium maritypicum]|uniref:Transcriptional regulator n=1 Tax=Microbacterium maritypicum TaxID=33918 RepID=A0A4Y4B9L6_MICMQ|nr:transcriptional regulator [Microbacterium liquefaciens]GGV62223.1 transcriptional regulator [Microbacterium liquefaciens]